MLDIQEKKFDEVYCATCGKIIKAQAELYPFCGVRQIRTRNIRKRFVCF